MRMRIILITIISPFVFYTIGCGWKPGVNPQEVEAAPLDTTIAEQSSVIVDTLAEEESETSLGIFNSDTLMAVTTEADSLDEDTVAVFFEAAIPPPPEAEPGAEEQPEISISFGSNPLFPVFNLSTPVTGAEAYQIMMATDPEIVDIFWISEFISDFPFNYPPTAPSLEFDSLYYARTLAIKNERLHGLVGNAVMVQIPSFTKPVLLSESLFSWNASEPPAPSYEVRVSPHEDMTNIIWSDTVTDQAITIPEGIFDWETTYFWQVQALDGDGNSFGIPSDIGTFTTETVKPPALITPVNEQVTTLTPLFSWTGVPQAAQYGIGVGEDEEISSIMWSELTQETSITYPDGALILDYGQTYYWQVIPLDKNGETFGDGAASIIANFQTPEPPQPVESAPVIEEEVTTLYPPLSLESFIFADTAVIEEAAAPLGGIIPIVEEPVYEPVPPELMGLDYGYKGFKWGSSKGTIPRLPYMGSAFLSDDGSSITMSGKLGPDDVTLTYSFADSGFWKVEVDYVIDQFNVDKQIEDFLRIEKGITEIYGAPKSTQQIVSGPTQSYSDVMNVKYIRAFYKSSWVVTPSRIDLVLNSLVQVPATDLPILEGNTSFFKLIYFNPDYMILKEGLPAQEKLPSIFDIY